MNSFIKSSKTKTPTPITGGTSLPPIGDSRMYIEISAINYGQSVFCSFERTDIIQTSQVSFYSNRFSAGTSKSMGRFRIQLLLSNKTCSTCYNSLKNDLCSNSSFQWTLVSSNFAVESYGIKMIFDEIDSPVADICCSNITIIHSVY